MTYVLFINKNDPDAHMSRNSYSEAFMFCNFYSGSLDRIQQKY